MPAGKMPATVWLGLAVQPSGRWVLTSSTGSTPLGLVVTMVLSGKVREVLAACPSGG
ncbi:MAG: hypothetical protein JXR37_28835 [Kiritimatiellae bacterium]|nr:hypothetical protein [Kiritimatiellia bacterium]